MNSYTKGKDNQKIYNSDYILLNPKACVQDNNNDLGEGSFQSEAKSK